MDFLFNWFIYCWIICVFSLIEKDFPFSISHFPYVHQIMSLRMHGFAVCFSGTFLERLSLPPPSTLSSMKLINFSGNRLYDDAHIFTQHFRWKYAILIYSNYQAEILIQWSARSIPFKLYLIQQNQYFSIQSYLILLIFYILFGSFSKMQYFSQTQKHLAREEVGGRLIFHKWAAENPFNCNFQVQNCENWWKLLKFSLEQQLQQQQTNNWIIYL